MNDTIREGYELLCAYIIRRACEDYYYRCLGAQKNEKQMKTETDALRRFFRSEWFKMLSNNTDGEALMRVIEEKRRTGQKLFSDSEWGIDQ